MHARAKRLTNAQQHEMKASMHDDPPPLQEKRRSKKKKTQPTNPLIRGIVAFCDQQSDVSIVLVHETGTTTAAAAAEDNNKSTSPDLNPPNVLVLAISDLPKRYTAFAPLLLLPPSSTGAGFNNTASTAWTRFYSTLGESQRADLFRCIAEEGFRGSRISRIAINAPIAADGEVDIGTHMEVGDDDGQQQEATTRHLPNVLRSPSGLLPVYGDWGPPLPPEQHRVRILAPTVEDFEHAFWTATVQHEGITQVWAPLFTMFSRGNVAEKARILGLQSWFPGVSHDHVSMPSVDVVDMYVGIGYFAFCYLKRQVRRVYGWDINPWSIEGLRRGCERNGWKCLVVRVDAEGGVEGEGGVMGLAEQIREGDQDGREENVVRCVAFLGDNKWAAKVLQEIQAEFSKMEGNGGVKRPSLNIRHANLGLLPTSKASWRDAVKILTTMSESSKGGWLHVHENVDMRRIERMAGEVVDQVNVLVQDNSRDRPFDVSCAHVEQVKTYAPGVMHCVFDVEIQSNG
jgi:tRNA wybutosine-synthesizing protein 2